MKILFAFVSLALAMVAQPTFAQAGIGQLFLKALSSSAGNAVTDAALNDKAIVDRLRSVADETNKKLLPKIVDNGVTRLDRIEAGPGKRLTYKYTVLDVRDMDLEATRRDGPGTIRKQLCSQKETAAFFRHGVTLVHMYQGPDRVPLMTVAISPGNCGFG